MGEKVKEAQHVKKRFYSDLCIDLTFCGNIISLHYSCLLSTFGRLTLSSSNTSNADEMSELYLIVIPFVQHLSFPFYLQVFQVFFCIIEFTLY